MNPNQQRLVKLAGLITGAAVGGTVGAAAGACLAPALGESLGALLGDSENGPFRKFGEAFGSIGANLASSLIEKGSPTQDPGFNHDLRRAMVLALRATLASSKLHADISADPAYADPVQGKRAQAIDAFFHAWDRDLADVLDAAAKGHFEGFDRLFPQPSDETYRTLFDRHSDEPAANAAIWFLAYDASLAPIAAKVTSPRSVADLSDQGAALRRHVVTALQSQFAARFDEALKSDQGRRAKIAFQKLILTRLDRIVTAMAEELSEVHNELRDLRAELRPFLQVLRDLTRGAADAPIGPKQEAFFAGLEQRVKDHVTTVVEKATEKILDGIRSASHRPTATSLTPALPIGLEPPAHYVERDDLVEDLVTQLAGVIPTRLVYVGGAGMGKSTLMQRTLNDPRIATTFEKRRWVLRCDQLKQPSTTLPTIFTVAFALPPETARQDVDDPTLNLLNEAPGILVLDNLETFLASDSALTESLLLRLCALPNLHLLATWRGHRPPPALASLTPREPRLLAPPERLAVVRQIASNCTATDAALSEFLADEAFGVPLITSLVAHQLARRDLSEIAATWRERRLASVAKRRAGAGAPDARRDDYLLSLDLSWQSPLLGAPGQRLAQALALLPAGLPVALLAPLLGADHIEAEDGVIDSGLALRESVAGVSRLRMLPSVREGLAQLHPVSSEWASLVATAVFADFAAWTSAAPDDQRSARDAAIAKLPNLDALLLRAELVDAAKPPEAAG